MFKKTEDLTDQELRQVLEVVLARTEVLARNLSLLITLAMPHLTDQPGFEALEPLDLETQEHAIELLLDFASDFVAHAHKIEELLEREQARQN